MDGTSPANPMRPSCGDTKKFPDVRQRSKACSGSCSLVVNCVESGVSQVKIESTGELGRW
jgi:hypothetical protein